MKRQIKRRAIDRINKIYKIYKAKRNGKTLRYCAAKRGLYTI